MSSQNHTDKTRRRVLKKVVIGGSAVTVSHWTRPVVESVILPLHARTSGEPEISAQGFDSSLTEEIMVSFPGPF